MVADMVADMEVDKVKVAAMVTNKVADMAADKK